MMAPFILKTFYRRKLPHLQRDGKPHFVTFCTHQRWILPENARSITLNCCLYDNGSKLFAHAVVVMPDHVHMIFTPLVDEDKQEVCSLARIMDRIKGASAHLINRELGRNGRVWQTESFDRVLRASEKLEEKIAYLLENPIRKGLVREWKDYQWFWCADQVNPFRP
ncbi:MAG TPA: transposase [Terriglobales bacterium]|nr:transposase [Terriglobales bacterium]